MLQSLKGGANSLRTWLHWRRSGWSTMRGHLALLSEKVCAHRHTHFTVQCCYYYLHYLLLTGRSNNNTVSFYSPAALITEQLELILQNCWYSSIYQVDVSLNNLLKNLLLFRSWIILNGHLNVPHVSHVTVSGFYRVMEFWSSLNFYFCLVYSSLVVLVILFCLLGWDVERACRPKFKMQKTQNQTQNRH